jgi:predicted nucleic acid-binding protein
MLIVADAGPILSFVRAGYFDLLRGVVGTLTIPEAKDVRQAAWIRRETVADRSFVEQLPARLHHGEREALAQAKECGGAVLVDDREAQRAA